MAAAGAAVVVLRTGSGGPAHVLTAPDSIGSYVRRPQLEQEIPALRNEVITKSAGEASHVVSGVYENSSAAGQAPKIILFIGGNLSGVSPGGFITSFTHQFAGVRTTSAGSMGGQAACVSAQASVPGSVALCVWADNDTFGVVASPAMDAAELGSQMRVIRPGVERPAR